MTDVFELDCSPYVVRRSGSRSAPYWCTCRSERRGDGCEQNGVKTVVRLLLAMQRGGEMYGE